MLVYDELTSRVTRWEFLVRLLSELNLLREWLVSLRG